MMLATALAGIMGFLKERNIPIEDWVSFTGEKLRGSLRELEGKGADVAMRRLLVLQVLPGGAQVVNGVLTAERAEVTVTPLPSATLLEKFGASPQGILGQFGITRKDFESIYGLYEPAMAAIGLRLTHRLAGGQEILCLVPAPDGGSPDARPGPRQ